MSLLSYTVKLIETRNEYLSKNIADGNGEFVYGDGERLVANAKAEQILDDLYHLYIAIKDINVAVAEMIKDSMKGTYYMAIIKGPDKVKKKRNTTPDKTASRRKKNWA